MKTALPKDLFVIDGQELQKRIDNLLSLISGEEDAICITYLKGKLKVLKELQQSLFPLEPIVEKAFNAGHNYGYDLGESNYIGCDREETIPDLQDFLTKPIEL